MVTTKKEAAAEQPESRLLDIPHAAQFLGTTVHAVRSLLWNDEIPFVSLGKKHLIDRRDLERWIDSNKHRNGHE